MGQDCWVAQQEKKLLLGLKEVTGNWGFFENRKNFTSMKYSFFWNSHIFYKIIALTAFISVPQKIFLWGYVCDHATQAYR